MDAPIDVTNIRIETPRLILRPWRMADLELHWRLLYVIMIL